MNRYTGAVARAFDTYVRDNPVVIRDLRTRMRGLGAFGLLIGYLLLVSIVMCVVFYSETGWGQTARVAAYSRIGSGMFIGLAWTQAIVLLLVIPGVISSAVSREYEKKTIEMVALSGLNSFLFVFGKLISALLYCLVLVVSTLPLAGICLMFGGISPEEIAVTYLLTVVFCFMMCSVGLYLSTVIGKTVGAVILFYAFNWFYVIHMGLIMAQIFSRGSMKSWSSLMIPANAAFSGMESATICGVPIPIAIITVVVQILVGVILLYAAAARVKHWRCERAGVLRTLLAGAFLLFAFLWFGDASLGASFGSSPSLSLTAFPLLVLSALIPFASVMATGPLRKASGQSMANYLFNAKNILKPDMSGAMSYVTVISLLTYVSAAIAFYMNVGPRTLGSLYGFYVAEQLFLLLAAVWLAASTGILFSALFRSRTVAAIMSLVVVGAACIAYYGQHSLRFSNIGSSWGPVVPPTTVWPDHLGLILASYVCFSVSGLCLALTDIALKKAGGVAE